jgi:hypothetical protein
MQHRAHAWGTCTHVPSVASTSLLHLRACMCDELHLLALLFKVAPHALVWASARHAVVSACRDNDVVCFVEVLCCLVWECVWCVELKEGTS